MTIDRRKRIERISCKCNVAEVASKCMRYAMHVACMRECDAYTACRSRQGVLACFLNDNARQYASSERTMCILRGMRVLWARAGEYSVSTSASIFGVCWLSFSASVIMAERNEAFRRLTRARRRRYQLKRIGENLAVLNELFLRWRLAAGHIDPCEHHRFSGCSL